jgi:hypothetical protein
VKRLMRVSLLFVAGLMCRIILASEPQLLPCSDTLQSHHVELLEGKAMNWDAVGAIGEIVGALAVVLTLGYLGVQTRHVHRTARSDARQRILDEWSDALSDFVDSEENRTVLVRGLEDFESLGQSDLLMFNHWLASFGSNLFNALRLRDEGILDEEAFMYISDNFVGTCCTSGGAVWWHASTSTFPPSLVRYVNQQVATRQQEDLPNISDLYRLQPISPSG